MAADIAKNPAVFRPFEKPAGPGGVIEPMRSKAHHLDDPSDRPVPDQFPGKDGAFHMEPLAVIDHVFSARSRGRRARLLQLVERGERRLVGEVILARLHHANAERASIGGNGRRRDEMNLGIIEDVLERTNRLGLRKMFDKASDFFRVGVVDITKRPACLDQSVALAVDVAVVEGCCGKNKFTSFHHRRRLALRRIGHSIGF